MENLVNFLEAWGGGWHSTSTGGDFNPIVNGEYTVMGGKKVNVDTDRVMNKRPDRQKKFALDEPTDNDVLDLDGSPKTENEKALIRKFAADEPFFILGHAGWGKTSIIQKIAKQYKKHVITIYLDQIPVEDLSGIPISVKDEETGQHYQEVLLPTWAQYIFDNPDKEFLLFMDELNLASHEVLNAIMSIILEKTVCGVKLKNMMVGSAGNYMSESDAVHELPSPIISRVAPIIIWNDESPEAWDEWMNNYLRPTWSGKLNGKADPILDVIDKYKEFFKNPREIEHKIFKWIENTMEIAERKHIPFEKYKYVFDKSKIEDDVCSLFVHDRDVDNLRALKKEIMSNADRRRAVQNITNTIYDALYGTAVSSSSQKQSNKLSTMSDEGLQNYLKYVRAGFITRKNSKDIIIISRDNLCDIFPLTKQQQDQIENVMGDVTSKTDGYKWQTEKDAKKEHPNWLTYEEACKKYPDMK